jgi:thiamine biosynthesis lipoprotein
MSVRLTGSVECASWEQQTIPAMGSDAVIIAGDPPSRAMTWALAELARLERCWSRFLPDSELCALNRSAGGWHTMSDRLGQAVDRALRLHLLTDGLFDPTVLDRMMIIGYDRPFSELDHDQSGPTPLASPPPGTAGIERSGDRIRLPVGTSLDLGGIGKGLAADIVAVGLVAHGARSACVSLGGDIRVAGGVPTAGGWDIPVSHPLDPTREIGHVAVAQSAIVTSTTRFRAWSRNGTPMHHIIDPRSGLPAQSPVIAVVVTAPEAWLAEGLAKAALIAGPVAGRRLLDHSGFGGWLILRDGTTIATEWAPVMLA